MKGTILSLGELSALKDEEREIESTIEAFENGDYGRGTRTREMVDVGALRGQLRNIKAKIRGGQPKRITGATKDKLRSEAEKLENLIKDGMPTENELWALRGNPGIVMKQAMWEKRNAAHIGKWKQIMRQLEPQDPTACSVERLRKR